jgi:hypothetical protein
MQLLPIFASLEMLELVESPMHSFTTPAGHSFVLRQFDDFLYLGVSDSEPQEFVAMQLVILRDFLNMLYGPVTALLRPSSAAIRLERCTVLVFRQKFVLEDAVGIHAVAEVEAFHACDR